MTWPPDNPKILLLYNGGSGGIVTVPIVILDSCQGWPYKFNEQNIIK
jgi:hypothetical protein